MTLSWLLALLVIGAQERDVVGTYATHVTRVSGNCEMPAQDNPTEVARGDSGSVLLRHGGTTYGGRLGRDGQFTTAPKDVKVGETQYHISVTGLLARDTLDARVTVRFGTCEVVMRWLGSRERR